MDSKQLTPEEFFKEGAQAMQSYLAALAMSKGELIMAQRILAAPIPQFKLSEKLEF